MMKRQIIVSLTNWISRIPRRRRFALSTLAVTLVMLLLSLFPFSTMLLALPVLVIVVYAVSYFALFEGIDHIEWIVLFILPVYFCLTFVLFYFLLPVRWLTRVPFVFIVAVTTYAILLSENIFNAGVEKSLPLYRAAYSVANFVTLSILFFLFTVLISFRQHFLLNAFFGGVLSWPLFFHSIWIASPKNVLEERVYKFATILSVLLSFAILMLSFVPVKTSIYAVYTVAIAYVLIGVTQEIVQNTAFKEHIRTYIIIISIMSVLVLLTASWN